METASRRSTGNEFRDAVIALDKITGEVASAARECSTLILGGRALPSREKTDEKEPHADGLLPEATQGITRMQVRLSETLEELRRLRSEINPERVERG